MSAPPPIVIAAAEDQARLSPCGKSKRGAVLFSGTTIFGVGFNGPPPPMTCRDTGKADRDAMLCRRFCGLTCAHAEQRAIRNCTLSVSSPFLLKIAHIELVHVKIRMPVLGHSDGLVAGGRPSCEQCSVAILDVGYIAGVWLYEAPTPAEVETWERLCKGDSVAGSNPPGPPQPTWHRYTALEFHEATLAYRGLVFPKENV